MRGSGETSRQSGRAPPDEERCFLGERWDDFFDDAAFSDKRPLPTIKSIKGRNAKRDLGLN